MINWAKTFLALVLVFILGAVLGNAVILFVKSFSNLISPDIFILGSALGILILAIMSILKDAMQ